MPDWFYNIAMFLLVASFAIFFLYVNAEYIPSLITGLIIWASIVTAMSSDGSDY
tara:strand:+ start:1742 stop:1903 length:162 start_codon:yes stop_codon:yes gene_type:complete